MDYLYKNSRVVRFICSIRFTIFLLVTLAAILAIATVVESREGTAAVQLKVYRAFWFNVFLFAFTLNMLGGTYKRFRPLWVHLGFAVTHVGVFTILLGAFLTRNFCIEGQMTIPTGAERNYFIGNEDKVTLTAGGKDAVALFVPVDRGSKQRQLDVSGRNEELGLSVLLDEYYPDLSFERELQPGGDAPYPAVEFELQAMAASTTSWLVAREPQRSRLAMGPVELRIVEVQGEPPPEEPARAPKPNVLVFSAPDGSGEVEVAASAGNSETIQIGGQELKVTVKQTFGNFMLHGKDFHDQPGEPENPAAAFIVETGEKQSPDIAFAKYPDFSLQHGKEEAGYRVRYLFREASSAENRLSVYVVDGERLTYSARIAGKAAASGALEPGVPVDVMAGRITFTVKQFLPKARYSMRPVNGSQEARNPAVHAKLVPDEGEGVGVWLPWGETREVTVGGKTVSLVYRGDRFEVPFSLKLLKFTEDKYPGSMMSATYQSLTFLKDPETGRAEEVLIHMNEPLLYRGYTFFQSSFIPGETYTTVLSVSQDPGKWPTYIGYILMSAGMILMFYCKPYLARLDQRRRAKERSR